MAQEFLVARRSGHFVTYLVGWDVIWGPVWSMCRPAARRFPVGKAYEAAYDAADIVKPRPWCVPDFGGSHLEIQEV